MAVSVPYGTNVTALVASFTTTGASVKVGTTAQVSGITANNFTSPVTYTVTAADGSTQACTVTATVAVASLAAKVTTLTTLAGSGNAGSANGTGTAATFNNPAGIATDGTSLFVVDDNAIPGTVRRIQ